MLLLREFPRRTPLTDFRYETMLSRIEVIRASVPEDETELVWDVGLDRSRSHLTILIGVLRKAGPEGIGQALVHGALLLNDDSIDRSNMTFDELREVAIKIGCLESMYDVARRSIGMQSAQMDFDLDFPPRAPECEIAEAFHGGHETRFEESATP